MTIRDLSYTVSLIHAKKLIDRPLTQVAFLERTLRRWRKSLGRLQVRQGFCPNISFKRIGAPRPGPLRERRRDTEKATHRVVSRGESREGGSRYRRPNQPLKYSATRHVRYTFGRFSSSDRCPYGCSPHRKGRSCYMEALDQRD